ncbi:MAG: hypothetical protein COW28_06535, partial [bacterium (Candidatus Ratteibacteria) CG15_BIG_FIL_POST_REV_8_21_14_020_41_12]
MDKEIDTESVQEEEAERQAVEAPAGKTLKEGETVETEEKSNIISIDDIISGKRAEDKTPAWAK